MSAFTLVGTLIALAQPSTANTEAPRTLNYQALSLAFVGVLVVICVNGLLAVSELAFVTIRKTRILQLIEEGNKSAVLLKNLLDQPTRLLATIQIGLTLLLTFASTIAAYIAVPPLSAWIQSWKVTEEVSNILSLILVTLTVAFMALIFGQIIPKSIALHHPERFALIAVHPVRFLQAAMTPVINGLIFVTNPLLRPFGGSAQFASPVVNEQELKILVEAGEEHGVLEPEETDMIQSVLAFGDTVVRKVMTPRIDMTAIDAETDVEGFLTLVNESGHTRIPIFEGDLDNIIGIVHVKDLLRIPYHSWKTTSLREVKRLPLFVPETKKVNELLREFRKQLQQLAIVNNEYGVTAGLVTIEDLLEEIVGDIKDEHDTDEKDWVVETINDVVTILDARHNIHEVNDRMNLEIPENEADTIGGFVFGLLGHKAVKGEKVVWENVQFTIEETDGRRITKLRLHKLPID